MQVAKFEHEQKYQLKLKKQELQMAAVESKLMTMLKELRSDAIGIYE